MLDLLRLTTAAWTGVDDVDAAVRDAGTVLQRFDQLTHESGNVSWLVATATGRLFVKCAGARDGDAASGLGHAERVRLLRNAVELARSCDHPALARLRHVIESPAGPVLVYDAVAGEQVRVPEEQRGDPRTPYQRFAHLPAARLLAAFDTLVDLHVALAAEGWQAQDLYDGSLVVDLDSGDLHVIDLDDYRRGPSRNETGHLVGSTRFMAPEELTAGADLDERTTVFTLGRIVWHFGTRLTERAEDFCGSDELADVVRRATRRSPSERHGSVAELGRAWSAARG